MQALCQWDVQGDTSSQELIDFFHARLVEDKAARYAGEIVHAFWSGREGIDGRIEAAAEKWTLPRLAPVDRNTIRVAVVELLGGQVPPKVAINEAIEIAREYGGGDSSRFVNGILDEVFKRIGKQLG